MGDGGKAPRMRRPVALTAARMRPGSSSATLAEKTHCRAEQIAEVPEFLPPPGSTIWVPNPAANDFLSHAVRSHGWYLMATRLWWASQARCIRLQGDGPCGSPRLSAVGGRILPLSTRPQRRSHVCSGTYQDSSIGAVAPEPLALAPDRVHTIR